MADHDLFIEQLSRTIEPVKRPWRPEWRVMAWVVMALPCGALASLLVHRTFTDWADTGAAWVIFQLCLTFFTGTLAIRNAFLMSIAGQKSLSWKWFAPLVSLWLTIAFANMHLHHRLPVEGSEVGTNCYLFMVVVSVPMMAIVIGYLRRTRSLFPARSLAVAGAGVACMALTLLALCHPTHISALDFLMHIGATATIVVSTMLLGYKWVSLPRR